MKKIYSSFTTLLILSIPTFADETLEEKISQDINMETTFAEFNCGIYEINEEFTFIDEILEEKVAQNVNINQSVVITSMKTAFEELHCNIYEIREESIRDQDSSSIEDMFRYMPFIGLSNVGLGNNLDLRGQGNRANTSVQVLINGIYANILNSDVTPINTLAPTAIESIEILSSGGAVMYGSGTRGGVINITTQKQYKQPFFNAGVSYSNIIASIGHNINADAKFGAKINDKTHLSFGAAYILRGGPREGDVTNGTETNFGLIYDLSTGNSINFDIDYFYGDIKTSPNNSFMDIPNPTKSDRKTTGNGNLHNTQQRLDLILGYKGIFNENNRFYFKTFYHIFRIAYVDFVTQLNNYTNYNALWNGAYADQSGSFFGDKKAGLLVKYDLKHQNGRLILGLESVYNRGKRVMKQNIFATEGRVTTPTKLNNGDPMIYKHWINTSSVGEKWSNSLFVIEKYDFTQQFSLISGIRYEADTYSTNALYSTSSGLYDLINGKIILMYDKVAKRIRPSTLITDVNNNANGALNQTKHNIALEITPHYYYSDYGNLYVRYERGFSSPSPNNLLQLSDRTYLPTSLKKETYDTLEIGLKDFWADSVIFSMALFYTLTHNEPYTIGNAHSVSSATYGNYDQTQRMGIEIFSEQYLLDDILRLSESFTYIDARVLKNNGQSLSLKIPYVSNYKATLGIHYQPMRKFRIYLQNSFIGAQRAIKDCVTNQNVARVSNGQDTIPGYILTDLGMNYRAGDWSVSAGVRNLFDTFYYNYYTSNSNDSITGYRFLIGQGRTAFAEVRYSF